MVGTRVIAQRNANILPYVRHTNDSFSTFLCVQEDGKFYAGIAVEPINLENRLHYLVFFDDGHVQYVPTVKIRNVIGDFTWNGIHDNLAKFFRYYTKLREGGINSEVSLNFGRLKEGHIIKVELDGQWKDAKVITIFNRIIKIKFEGLNRFEWLFCESPRLEYIWRLIISNRLMNDCLSSVFVTNGNSILHLDDDDDNSLSEANWKHLSRNQIRDQINSQLKEPTRPFVRHICNKSCLSVQEKSNENCQANQLVRPLIAGWKRIGRNNDDDVAYITPCGRICENIVEIHIFLMRTGSLLGIDTFTFDSSIDCARIGDMSPESLILTEVCNHM